MLNRLPFRLQSALALCFFCFSAGLSAQTFRIESVTGNTLNSLDSTQLVTYTVLLENAPGGLHNVVPELTPPACSFNNGASYFSASYAGANGSLFPTAIGTWNNNSTKTLSFYVHLYNQAALCDGSGGGCDPGATFFELSLTHDTGNGPVSAQDPDDHLLMRTPGEPVYQLEQLVFDWQPPQPDFCLLYTSPGQSLERTLTFNGINIDRQDENTRIVLGLNLSIEQTAPMCQLETNDDPICPLFRVFGAFALGVSSTRFLDVVMVEGTESVVQNAQITDPVLSLGGEPLPHSAYGGSPDLDCVITEDSTQYFDVTHLPLSQSSSQQPQTVIEGIGLNSGSSPITFTASMGIAGLGLTLRSVELYAATRAQCTVGEEAFGVTPTAEQFHIADFQIEADGDASATLVVPELWRDAGRLKDGYAVTWYLTSNAVLTKIGSVESQDLDKQFNIFNEVINLETLGLDLTDVELEAVVRYQGASSSSFVSTKAASHAIAYAHSDVFQNQETGAGLDANLDPGEKRIFTYTATNTSASAVSGAVMSVDFSGIGDSIFLFNGQLVSSADQVQVNLPTVNSSASNVQSLDFQLIQTSLDCESVVVPVTVAYQIGQTQYSYTTPFDLALNCGIKEFTVTDTSGWDRGIFQLINGVETPVTEVPGQIDHGWEYADGTWSGRTNLPQFYYTLTSPGLDAGISGTQSVTFQHTPRFLTNQAGGVLEYNINNGQYLDLIEEIEGTTSIYNVIPFPDRNTFFEEYIANRRVWMSTPPEGEPFPGLTVARDIPPGLFGDEDGEITFSFLFQDVTNESVLGDPWDLTSFAYTYTKRIADDFFRVSGIPEITEKVCHEPVQVVTANNDFNYTFSFYTSIEDLVNNLPEETNTSGFWQPPLPQNPPSIYYIKITADNSTQSTSRIQRFFPIQVSAGSDCDPCGALDRNDDGTLDPVRITTDWGNLDIAQLVGVVNTAVACTLTIPATPALQPEGGRSGRRRQAN